MKILMVNTGCKLSSTGKIAYGFYKELMARGHECVLLYSEKVGENKDGKVIPLDSHIEIELHRKINQITGYHSIFAPLAMRRFKRIYEEFQPDIVQLYNIHGYFLDIYRMFDYLATKKIPIVYSMLDEHPYLGYCCYSYNCEQFKTGCQNCEQNIRKGYLGSLFFNRARETFLLKEKAYEKNNIAFVGPKWVLERARQSLLLRNRELYEVDEYIDTKNTFVPRAGENIREALDINTGEIMILNVAPSNDKRKGVDDFIEMARKCPDERYKFVNVGYQGKDENLPTNFIGIGFVTDQKQLAGYYSAADALVCTSYADTMPNVCLEALSCGTPVYGYDITGIPYVAEKPYGKFVKAGSIEEMLSCIMHVERKYKTMAEKCREYAKQRYSLEVYASKMLEIYNERLNSGKE